MDEVNNKFQDYYKNLNENNLFIKKKDSKGVNK